MDLQQLTYYALRVMGIDGTPSIAQVVQQMEARGAESQLLDGGISCGMLVDFGGNVIFRAGATGEATAIGILANTVLPAP